MIAGEVPLHYLLNINPDRFTQAVELGVGAARQWCVQNGIPVNPITPDHKIPVRPTPPDRGNLVSLSFEERMDGAIAAGVTDYEQGNRGGEPVTLRLKMYADDLDVFISDPDHTARVTGTLELGPRLGGTATVSDGWFNLMPFSGDIDERWMFYWLPLDGTTRVLSGYKKMRDDPEEDLGELWRETTTLFTHILEDAPGPPPRDALIEAFSAGRPEPTGDVVAAGILRVDLKDFAGLLSSISADGPSRRAEASAKARFSAFFVGGLWDVYASRLLPASPL